MAFSTLLARMTLQLYIRLTALLLSIAALIILATLLVTMNNNMDYWADGNGGTFVFLPFVGNCWTIVYSIIVLGIVLGSNKHQHPEVDVAMDFFGWALNCSMGIMLLWWTVTYVVDETEYECDPRLGFDGKACGFLRKVVGLHCTGAILIVVVGCVPSRRASANQVVLTGVDRNTHCVLFFKACVEAHHRRISDQRSKAMELGGVARA